MRFHALAADYDGTLARHGVIDDATLAALMRLRASGRKLVLVTGRELDELLAVIPEPTIFDRIVAENGAVLYRTSTREARVLAEPPPAMFAQDLRNRGVEHVSTGRVIVATVEPFQQVALDAIHDLGLELQVIFNKGAVMVLPTGVNKATGLAAALVELGLSSHNVVAVGDAENDHKLLDLCECGAAVANALPALKRRADIVLERDHGDGVAELIDRLVADDLGEVTLLRRRATLGRADDCDVMLDPYASSILTCGTSGSGKTTLTTGILEGLVRDDYQVVVIDPEGDYASLDFAVVLGSPTRAPLVEEVLEVLRDPSKHVSINLLAVPLEHRPELAGTMLAALGELRSRTGRPHWLVIDEAHHLLPSSWEPAGDTPLRNHGILYVTVHPESVSPAALATVDTVLAIGEHPEQRIADLARVAGREPPTAPVIDKLPHGRALLWRTSEPDAIVIETPRPVGERRRHSRKYAEGNLGAERSFYFRGPDGKLNLKAANLQRFLEIADGVDDATWLYHLRRGDYSAWVRTQVKDVALADKIAVIERDSGDSVDESRRRTRAAVDEHYTLPTDQPSGTVEAVDARVGTWSPPGDRM